MVHLYKLTNNDSTLLVFSSNHSLFLLVHYQSWNFICFFIGLAFTVCSHAAASAALGSQAPLPLYPHTISSSQSHCSSLPGQRFLNSGEPSRIETNQHAQHVRQQNHDVKTSCRTDVTSHVAHAVLSSHHVAHQTGQQPTQRSTAPLYDLHALKSG